MREKFSVLTKMVMQAAESLNHLRQVSSARILNRVVDILKDMGMNNARMELHLVPAKEPVALEMEFYFSANTGEPLRSMKDTASGGEISRIALAIEMVISNLLKRQTLIFDEIDVGISGRVAIQVAKKIGILSKSLQILCITHLPQTACIADKHYKIAKKVIDGHTFAEADLLNESQHLNAIALMISGTYDSASALESAREMEKSVKNG
jgi:DNA repair protein RecN (Recombination protein N)